MNEKLENASYFEKQLVFYGSYHSNRINVIIHLIFVPLILWTSGIMLSLLGSYGQISILGYEYSVDPSFIITLLYCSYYLTLETRAAILYTPILLMINYSSQQIAKQNNGFQIALIVFGLGWIAQFASHAFAEKRAPALFDGLLQALSLAPLFVFLDILFVMGYNPTYKAKVKILTSKEIGKFKAQQIKSKPS